VLKALKGHPEADAMWEKHINKIFDGLDIVYTTHVSTEVGTTGSSSFCADKSPASLSLAPTLLWRKVYDSIEKDVE
jgi:hypothetical protein